MTYITIKYPNNCRNNVKFLVFLSPGYVLVRVLETVKCVKNGGVAIDYSWKLTRLIHTEIPRNASYHRQFSTNSEMKIIRLIPVLLAGTFGR